MYSPFVASVAPITSVLHCGGAHGASPIVSPVDSQFGDLIDPGTGAITPALGVPEMVNPLAANSAAVVFNYHWNATYPDFYSWVITYPDGGQVKGENRFPVVSQGMLSGESRFPIVSQVVLSPDGQTLAQVETDGQLILVGPDGQVTKGPALEDASANLYWSPVSWRIPMPEPCGTALPARLVVGNSGVVSTNTTPNNVRSEAATGSAIGQLQPGEDFQVLAGPVCVDGMYWWQIDNYHGLVGWTAEGVGTEYWLEPIIG